MKNLRIDLLEDRLKDIKRQLEIARNSQREFDKNGIISEVIGQIEYILEV